MRLTLTVLTPGKGQGRAIPVTLSPFLIGRDPGCHLRPTNPYVSSRHCALLTKDGRVFVRDFGSTNGTFLNGRQLGGEVELLNGDQLRVGPLEFKVAIETGTSVSRPTPPPPTKAPAPQSTEDELAALLLADDGTSPRTGEPVPEGDTKLEIPPAPEAGGGKPPEAKPKASGDTSEAAKAILEKYLKRPRT